MLFTNAVGEVTRERVQSFLTDDHIDRMVQAYRQFTDGEGFSKLALHDETREKDRSLSIRLYARQNGDNRKAGAGEAGKSLKDAIAE